MRGRLSGLRSPARRALAGLLRRVGAAAGAVGTGRGLVGGARGATAVGRVLGAASRLSGHGGHALPGLVVARLWPSYAGDVLAHLPEGVIVITGTNGKTTTTKMVVEVLESCGKRVLTNSTGSNLTRGIVSSVVAGAGWRARLPHDLAVFEVDEAYAPRFVAQVVTRWVLALNVSRDQLDRFSEVSAVARMVGTTMGRASVGVVANADDPRLRRTAGDLAASGAVAVHWFGVAGALRGLFLSDEEVITGGRAAATDGVLRPQPEVELTSFEGQVVTYDIQGAQHRAELGVSGQHNFLNGAAALALVRHLLPVGDADLLTRLSAVEVAPGRGEVFVLPDGSSVRLALVKNPAGFRQALASYLHPETVTGFAVNDAWADGRDVSWLWDVDLGALAGREVSMTSGTRAADMALRLDHAGARVGVVERDLHQGLRRLLEHEGPKTVFATYTAMVALRAALGRIGRSGR